MVDRNPTRHEVEPLTGLPYREVEDWPESGRIIGALLVLACVGLVLIITFALSHAAHGLVIAVGQEAPLTLACVGPDGKVLASLPPGTGVMWRASPTGVLSVPPRIRGILPGSAVVYADITAPTAPGLKADPLAVMVVESADGMPVLSAPSRTKPGTGSCVIRPESP